jgi:hypothetical protein
MYCQTQNEGARDITARPMSGTGALPNRKLALCAVSVSAPPQMCQSRVFFARQTLFAAMPGRLMLVSACVGRTPSSSFDLLPRSVSFAPGYTSSFLSSHEGISFPAYKRACLHGSPCCGSDYFGAEVPCYLEVQTGPGRIRKTRSDWGGTTPRPSNPSHADRQENPNAKCLDGGANGRRCFWMRPPAGLLAHRPLGAPEKNDNHRCMGEPATHTHTHAHSHNAVLFSLGPQVSLLFSLFLWLSLPFFIAAVLLVVFCKLLKSLSA